MRKNGRLTLSHRTRLKSRWVAAFILSLLLVCGGVIAASVGGHGGFPLFVTACAFSLGVAPYSAFVATSFFRDIRRIFLQQPVFVWIAPVVYLGVYVLYGLGTQSFSWQSLLKLGFFLAVPTACAFASRHMTSVSWLDAIAVAAIWMPFDLGWLASIWSWPEGEGAYVINTAIAVVLAATLFICFRRYEFVNIRFFVNRIELLTIFKSLTGFMLLAIPFGFATDFIAWNVKKPDIITLVGTPLSILFFIAIPEEFLFRGLIQNMLRQVLKSQGKALTLASLFFGLTHLNNAPLMDWRYVTLATMAGFFYGHTYSKCRSLLAPALVHMGVDTLWVLLFLK
jgi:membrane protease YdiL (CAAX protease family)